MIWANIEFHCLRTMFFGVYKCWGPGAATIRGVPLAQELDFESAHLFLVNSFVNGRHWITPSDALLTDNIPINQRKKKNSIGNCTVTVYPILLMSLSPFFLGLTIGNSFIQYLIRDISSC